MASAKGQPAPILIQAKNAAAAAFKDVIASARRADKAIEGLGKRQPRTLIESIRVLQGRMKGLDVTTRQVNAALANMEKAGKRIGKLGLAGGLISAGAAKVAGDYSLKIAEIATLADDGAAATKRLTGEVLDLSDKFGLARDDVSSAYYQGLSAGAEDGAEAIGLLDEAAKLAIGGVSNLTTSVDTITSVINAYNGPMSDAGRISDILFKTVKLGKTNLDQLGASVANVTPTAAAAGVEFDQVAASIAAITAGGTKTKVATTQLRSLFVALAKGGPEIDRVYEGFGGLRAVIEDQGLVGALDLLAEATGRDIGQLSAMLGSVEAVQAVLSLTGPNAERFAGALDGMADSAGASADAFKIVDASLGAALGRAITNTSNAFVAFGESLTPIVSKIANVAGAIARWARSFAENNPFGTLFVAGSAAASMLGGLLLTIGKFGRPLLRLVGLLTGVSGAATFLAKAIGVVRVAGLALIATPMGAFLAGIGIAIGVVTKKWLDLRAEIEANQAAGEAAAKTYLDLTKTINDADKLGAGAVAEDAIAFRREASLQRLSQAEIDAGKKALEARLEQVRELTRARDEAEAKIVATRVRNAEIAAQAELDAQAKALEGRIESEGDALDAINARIKAAEANEKASLERLRKLREANADVGQDIDDALAGKKEVRDLDPTEQLREVIALQRELREAGSAEEAEAIQRQIAEHTAQAKTIENDTERVQVLQALRTANNELGEKAAELEAQEIRAAEERRARDEAERASQVEKLEALKLSLEELTAPKAIPIEVDTTAAENKLAEIEARLAALQSGDVPSATPPADAKPPTRRAAGGWIPGYGFGDSVRALLSPGEFVVKPDRAKRFADVLQFMNFAKEGALSRLRIERFASGGFAGIQTPVAAAAFPGASASAAAAEPSGTPVNFTFDGTTFPMRADQDVAETLRRTLSREVLKRGIR